MKDKIIKSINRIEEGLLNGEDTVKLSFLARKIFLKICNKNLVKWIEKEIKGYEAGDISKFGSYYRKLKNCDCGIFLFGQGGGWEYNGFRKYHVFEEWECTLTISEICRSVKKNTGLLEVLKEVSDEERKEFGLSNFVFYEGMPNWMVEYTLWHLESIERGFREKLNTYIIEIQDKYKIENLPELRLKKDGVTMEANFVNNNIIGSKGNNTQSGGNSEVNNQGGLLNTQNNKSKVDQKPGWISRIIGWLIK